MGRTLVFCVVQMPLAVLATAVLTAAASLAGLVRRGAVQALSRVWSRLLLRLFRVEVRTEGLAQLPAGPAVYAANHSSSLDILVVLAHLPVDVRIIYKKSLSYVPLLGWSIAVGGPHPDRPLEPVPRAPQPAARPPSGSGAERASSCSPRARAAPTASVRHFKRGSFSLAIEAGVPVVPVSLAGVKALVPRGLTSLRPGRVTLRVHPAIASVRQVEGRRRGARRGDAARGRGGMRRRDGRERAAACLIAVAGCVARCSRRPILRPARLKKAIEAVVARPGLESAFWGIEVRSLASGRTLYALNAGKAFRPASTLKLVTTAAALDAFGPDARLRTTLADGRPPRRAGSHPGRRVPRGRRRPQSLGPLLPGPPDGCFRGDGGGARRGGREAHRGPRGRARGSVHGRPPRLRPGPGRTWPGVTGPRSRRSRSPTTSSRRRSRRASAWPTRRC